MLARDDSEHPVPEGFRRRFSELVSALVAGNFCLSNPTIKGVAPINPSLADFIVDQIEAYGTALAPLSDEVWGRSVYAWDGAHWQFLIDLTTTEEPVSDLVLHARLRDDDNGQIEVWSVHVP